MAYQGWWATYYAVPSTYPGIFLFLVSQSIICLIIGILQWVYEPKTWYFGNYDFRKPPVWLVLKDHCYEPEIYKHI